MQEEEFTKKDQGLPLDAHTLLPSYSSQLRSPGSFRPLLDTQLTPWDLLSLRHVSENLFPEDTWPSPTRPLQDPEAASLAEGGPLLDH